MDSAHGTTARGWRKPSLRSVLYAGAAGVATVAVIGIATAEIVSGVPLMSPLCWFAVYLVHGQVMHVVPADVQAELQAFFGFLKFLNLASISLLTVNSLNHAIHAWHHASKPIAGEAAKQCAKAAEKNVVRRILNLLCSNEAVTYGVVAVTKFFKLVRELFASESAGRAH